MKVRGRWAQSKDLNQSSMPARGIKTVCNLVCKSCYRDYKIESGYSKNLASNYARQHNNEFYRETYVSSRSKRCPQCKQSMAVADFFRKVHSADGFASCCKVCDTRKTGQSRIKKRYGLTLADYAIASFPINTESAPFAPKPL